MGSVNPEPSSTATAEPRPNISMLQRLASILLQEYSNDYLIYPLINISLCLSK